MDTNWTLNGSYFKKKKKKTNKKETKKKIVLVVWQTRIVGRESNGSPAI